MADETIATVHASERKRAIAVLMSAFVDDPLFRWLYPDDVSYRTHGPRVFDAYAGRAFDLGTAWRLGDFDAVAMWLPPGVEPGGEATNEVILETTEPEVSRDAIALFDALEPSIPTYEHWYLAWLAVPHDRAGLGLGSALVRACLERVDADRLPTYVESPNPRNLTFYERHGFALIGEAQAGSSPTIRSMVREAR